MAALSVGGLVSGLDTNSIVAQLTALEQNKVTRELQKRDKAQSTLDKFKELQTRLGNLSIKANSLQVPDKFNIFKSTSNYEDYASISGKEGATAGQYELVVNQLASTQKVVSKSFSAINTPVLTGGVGGKIYLSLSEATKKADPTKKDIEIEISGSDTLKDIVSKINAAEGSGVKASIMTQNGENRLVLTAVDTGSQGFYIREGAGNATNILGSTTGLGILEDNSQKAIAGNALLTIDGKAATGATTFDKLNTYLTTNNLATTDVIGIYLPVESGGGGSGWKTYAIHDGTNYRSIKDVLYEINNDLGNSGFKARLNSSGEIVLEGDLASDQNFGGTSLGQAKIQIGTLASGLIPDSNDSSLYLDSNNSSGIFSNVKKDMGTFTLRNSFSNILNEGVNAVYTIDGMAVSSQSNDDDKARDGTVFTLKRVSQPGMDAIKVSLDIDMSAIATKITEFIEEFNSLLKFIDENAKATIKEDTDKITGIRTNTREVGAFTGDSNISSLRENLRKMVTGTIDEISGILNNCPPTVSTVYSSASRIGIITEKDGSLSVDSEKLTKALNADFVGVRRLFTSNSFSDTTGFTVGRASKDAQTGIYEIDHDGKVYLNGKEIRSSAFGNVITTDSGLSIEFPENWLESTGGRAKVTFVRGIADQISNFVEKAKSSVDGFFKTSEQTYQKRIDEIEKRVSQLQTRVDTYNKRLSAQFAALERSMANLQAQSSNMMAAISAMPTNYSNKK